MMTAHGHTADKHCSGLRHFYLSNHVAWASLRSLREAYARGIAGRYTNRHAWDSILRVYFPQGRSDSNIKTVPDEEHAKHSTSIGR